MLLLIIFEAIWFLDQKRAKSKNGPIFTFNTAIESYEYTNFKNVKNFEKNKNWPF